jgi:uncharacterized lipoprotein YddW (UPF0748 family)
MNHGRPITALICACVLIGAACSTGSGDSAGAPSTTSPADPTPSTTATTSTTPSTTSTTLAPTPLDPPASSVWVHLFDETLKTPEGVDEMLDEVAEAGIDAVIAQVARRHDAYYESGYLPRTPDPGLEPGFDVLAALVEGARTRGLQVHAWFVVAPGYHHQYDALTLPSGHVWLDHGPGSPDSWMTVAHDGSSSTEYFDVGLEAVHEHVEQIVTDIATRYAVDGVHLDYVRYDGARWGYHPDALEQFSLTTGRTDRPSIDDAQWSAWRRERTAALVERAGEALAAARPRAMLSAAVIAGGPGPSSSPGGFPGTRAATHMYQDWPDWLERDLVDFLVAMSYTRESNAEHASWFRQWVAFAGELAERHPGQVGIGVGAYLNSVDQALTQIELVQTRVGTVGVYSYQQDSASAPRGEVLARCCGS